MARKRIAVELWHEASCAPFQRERRECSPLQMHFATIRFGCFSSATPPREVPTEDPPSSPLEMPPGVPELPGPPTPEIPDTLPDGPPQETPLEMPIEEGRGWPPLNA